MSLSDTMGELAGLKEIYQNLFCDAGPKPPRSGHPPSDESSRDTLTRPPFRPVPTWLAPYQSRPIESTPAQQTPFWPASAQLAPFQPVSAQSAPVQPPSFSSGPPQATTKEQIQNRYAHLHRCRPSHPTRLALCEDMARLLAPERDVSAAAAIVNGVGSVVVYWGLSRAATREELRRAGAMMQAIVATAQLTRRRLFDKTRERELELKTIAPAARCILVQIWDLWRLYLAKQQHWESHRRGRTDVRSAQTSGEQETADRCMHMVVVHARLALALKDLFFVNIFISWAGALLGYRDSAEIVGVAPGFWQRLEALHAHRLGAARLSRALRRILNKAHDTKVQVVYLDAEGGQNVTDVDTHVYLSPRKEGDGSGQVKDGGRDGSGLTVASMQIGDEGEAKEDGEPAPEEMVHPEMIVAEHVLRHTSARQIEVGTSQPSCYGCLLYLKELARISGGSFRPQRPVGDAVLSWRMPRNADENVEKGVTLLMEKTVTNFRQSLTERILTSDAVMTKIRTGITSRWAELQRAATAIYS